MSVQIRISRHMDEHVYNRLLPSTGEFFFSSLTFDMPLSVAHSPLGQKLMQFTLHLHNIHNNITMRSSRRNIWALYEIPTAICGCMHLYTSEYLFPVNGTRRRHHRNCKAEESMRDKRCTCIACSAIILYIHNTHVQEQTCKWKKKCTNYTYVQLCIRIPIHGHSEYGNGPKIVLPNTEINFTHSKNDIISEIRASINRGVQEECTQDTVLMNLLGFQKVLRLYSPTSIGASEHQMNNGKTFPWCSPAIEKNEAFEG